MNRIIDLEEAALAHIPHARGQRPDDCFYCFQESLRAENERLRGALEGLRYLNGCWCCQGIPADGEHAESCDRARAALEDRIDGK